MTTPLESTSDAALVDLAVQGDQTAFEQIIKRHAGLVFSIAHAHLCDSDLAEDLLQEVFLRVYLNLHRLENRERLTPWMARLTRNLAIDWIRRGQRGSRLVAMVPFDETHMQVPDTETQGATQIMEDRERDEAVRVAIGNLKPEQREIVLLHFAEGLEQRDIAQRLGVHPSTVSRRLGQAVADLRCLVDPAHLRSTPQLQMPNRAAVRTATCIASVAGLSATAKASLQAAASAPVVMKSLASAKGLGAISTIAAKFAAGGLTMSLGKGIAGVAAVAVVGVLGFQVFKETGPIETRVWESIQSTPTAEVVTVGGPVTLGNGFQVGQEFRRHSVEEMVLTVMSALPDGMRLHEQRTSDYDSTMRVTERMADGTTRVIWDRGGSRVTHRVVNGQENPINEELSEMASRRALTLGPDGRAREVSVEVAQMPEPIRQALEAFDFGLLGYPAHPLEPGDTWSWPIDLTDRGSGVGEVRITLDRVEMHCGEAVAVFLYEMDFESEETVHWDSLTGGDGVTGVAMDGFSVRIEGESKDLVSGSITLEGDWEFTFHATPRILRETESPEQLDMHIYVTGRDELSPGV